MNIGDKVRFLNEVGGGIVAGFQGKNIVLVEDEDGFQMPMLVNEVVVVTDEDYSTTNLVEGKNGEKPVAGSKSAASTAAPEKEEKVTFKAPPMERRGGDSLSVYLAFVPIDSRELSNTRFEAYIINDSNYYIRYVYMTLEGASCQLRSTGEVEPNMKLFIEEFGREQLNSMERVHIQFIAYKRDKAFMPKPAVDVQLRIDSVKFYKLHTFQENDFFEEPALIYPVIENDRPARTLVIDANKLKQEMMSKAAADMQQPARIVKPGKKADEVLVVDLHAHELLDTTAGMTNTDILNHQLDVFRKTLHENEKNKGKKIVFIHGKGEGVLRAAVINELRYRFKKYTYQDASFQEYGYGATMVTIR